MIDADKLQYFTMAARMRGYAEGLIDRDRHSSLIHMLNKAADLLERVWDEQSQEKYIMGTPLLDAMKGEK